MPTASIRWDGNAGPYEELALSSAVIISNSGNGGEFQWDYTLSMKPPTSVATLVGSGNARTLVPDAYGTYVVQLVVNNDPAISNISSAAVKLSPSGLREPAPREALHWDPTNGWAPAFTEVFERLNHGVGAKPVAGSAPLGRIWHSPNSGSVDDAFEVCLQNSGGGYEWHNILTHRVNQNLVLEGTWDGSHIVMGGNHLWFDSGGLLRMKNGAPTSEFDGTPVGQQNN